MNNIRITLVDDHPMVIAGLETLLKPYAHIQIIDAYSLASDLIEGLRLNLPDVLVLDLILPDRNGKELVPELLELYPKLRILILTSLDTPAIVSSMMRRGCKGYLLKGAGPSVLVAAIETVHRGEEYLQSAIKEQLLQNAIKYKADQQEKNSLPELSEREKEILQLIASENTAKEISEKLYISFRTVENHRRNLIQKLDVKNVAGLVKIAIQLGLV